MNYRRWLSSVLAAGFLLAFVMTALPIRSVIAQTVEQADTFTFEEMGFSELSLRSPYDTTYIGFSIPATWQPTSDAVLLLQLNVLTSGSSNPATAQTAGLSGILRVRLNNKTVSTFLINQVGQQSLSVKLPLAGLLELAPDKQQVLALQLETDERCETNQFARIIIDPASSLTIPHQITQPIYDLTKLPFPILQNALKKEQKNEQVLLVVPDQARDTELRAALIVAAAMGRMAGDKLDIKLIPISKVHDADKQQHLIFVGLAASWSIFEKVSLPAVWSAGSFTLAGMAPDDGVIQMAPSLWDAGYTMLIVSANSDAGLEKAAQALSTANIRSDSNKALALIATVDSTIPPGSLAIDQTFQSLGFSSQRLTGVGSLYAGYEFELPADRSVGDDVYLELSFAHSALLDYNQSGIMISLNNEAAASIRLNDTTTQLSRVRIPLPAEAIHAGMNNLVIRADLLPITPCLDPRTNGLWLNVLGDSLLHLPVRSTPNEVNAAPIDLKDFPKPFSNTANLSNIMFVVEQGNMAAWNAAAQLAYVMGQDMYGPLVQFQTASPDVPEKIRADHDFIIVGQPKALPIIAELGAALPAPFDTNSNQLRNLTGAVTYRGTANSAAGYIQLLSSPWNMKHAILAVLGNNDTGVDLAARAFVEQKLKGSLSGNLAIVQAGSSHTELPDVSSSSAPIVATPTPSVSPTPEPPRVESRDTRTEPTPVPTPDPNAAVGSTPSVASQLLMLAGAILALLVVGAISFVILQRRKRRNRGTGEQENG